MTDKNLEVYLHGGAESRDEMSQLPDQVKRSLDEHLAQYESDPEGAHMWDPVVIGVPGGPVKTLVLGYTGRKSGKQLRTALQYYEMDGKVAVVASRGGTAENPVWYLNLEADPKCDVQIARRKFSAIARTAKADERPRWWDLIVEEQPVQAVYQTRTSRIIPVVILDPAGADQQA